MVSIEKWYSTQTAQVLDLVGDYAGRELFLLDGDALVLDCVDDIALDFDDGIQLLHAVWNVERFLSRLNHSKCVFHIAFFNENRGIVAAAAPKDIHRSKYALARAVILLHLKRQVHVKHPDIEVHQFQSMTSSDFRKYLQSNNVYFVMSHNGALRRRDVSVRDCLFVVRQALSLGLGVAIINEIEWRDSKIITRVIQANPPYLELGDSRREMESITPAGDPGCIKYFKEIVRLHPLSGDRDLTPRDRLTLSVLSVMLRKREGTPMHLMAAAFLLHSVCLRNLSLSERRLPVQHIIDQESYNAILDEFCKNTNTLIETADFENCLWESKEPDSHDLIDGRLLRPCTNLLQSQQVSELESNIQYRYNTLLECLETVSRVPIQYNKISNTLPEVNIQPSGQAPMEKTALLPFQHKVFDYHLSSIHVTVESFDRKQTRIPQRSVIDMTHWHNRRLLDSKPRTKWRNPERSKQLQMRNMEVYAASLTDTKGRAFTPTRIISPEIRGKNQSKSTAKKQSLKAQQIIKQNKKEKLKEESSWQNSWKRKLSEISTMEPGRKAQECLDFLGNLDDKKRAYLEPEIRLFILIQHILHRQGLSVAKDNVPESLMRDIWDQVRILRHCISQMPPTGYELFQNICRKLQLPECSNVTPVPKRQLSFTFDSNLIQEASPWGSLTIRDFELLHCGPYLERSTGSKPDSRVDFEPDKWQREVLDELDADHSVFVVAPTSAGKTFISFYAMSKILRESDDGVLVYVAPTKALVNQIAAEIHARLRKTYPPGSDKTLWAIYTRDVRVNDPVKSQILVTVPHLLQIMLLSAHYATSWASRVKCIIFDEIHSIGQTDDGLVWEQLLLLAPCRIIGLSATVGNPEAFTEWLSSTQRNLNIPLKLIRHNQRYSDLRKFTYVPPEKYSFKGLRPSHHQKVMLDPGSIDGLTFVHPIASLVNSQRQMPEDFSLEPRDCYLLWKSMIQHASSQFPVPEELSPDHALPPFIRRADVFQWETGLKKVLWSWMTNADSPYQLVRNDLENLSASPDYKNAIEDGIGDNEDGDGDGKLNGVISFKQKSSQLCASIFPLLVNLHEKSAMPALIFSYDRNICEFLAVTTLRKLKLAENEYKMGPTWKRKLKEYEKYLAEVEMQKRADEKSKKVNRRKSQSKEESIPDNPYRESHRFKGFDPDKPLEQFSFADSHKFDWAELEKEINGMKRSKKVNTDLLEALRRGIGVHHGGLNGRYRHFVERLFRAGFLRVVVATGTLALGINMPAPTVIFCGDSVYLTALNFRQAAGRAGRRGFDLLGNVIFHGVPRHKVYQLISSRLPDLTGHFPITTSLVLRLFILLDNSKQSDYAVRAINSLLSQPRLFLGGEDSRNKILHHLRFSIEYLRRQHLLGAHGEPLDLACIVAHLYHAERSAFAFHALVRAGYFRELCEADHTNTGQNQRTIIIVLAHLFGRMSLGTRSNEFLERRKIIKSPSVVRLPDMPSKALEVLREHNLDVLRTYSAYVNTFAKQHLQEPEKELPLSGALVGGTGDPETSRLLGALEATRSRSAFVGLSGHGDDFTSIKDLCNTVRSGIFLEQSVIPHLDIYPDEGMAPLNAYLYDFFCHGSLQPLEAANQISPNDCWHKLNDFSMVLATIVVALANYLDPNMNGEEFFADDTDTDDMASITGSEPDESTEPTKPSTAGSGRASMLPRTTPTQPMAWDDDDSDESSIPDDWEDNISQLSASRDKETLVRPGGEASNVPERLVVSRQVLEMFCEVKKEFDEKFHKIFA